MGHVLVHGSVRGSPTRPEEHLPQSAGALMVAYCPDCPDREFCMQGGPCDVARAAAAQLNGLVAALPWGTPPLRANDRRSWQAQHRARSVALDEARWSIRAARMTPVAGAEVTLHYRVPDRRRRDSDGPEPTKKVCIDALVLEGVLPDDSWVHVPRSAVEIHPPTAEPAAMWLELSNATPMETP